jgi:hypothetical protein
MIQVMEWCASRIRGNQLVIAGSGNALLQKVPFFPFGFLSKVIAQQMDGTNVAFTVNVLNSGLGLLSPGQTSVEIANPATTLPAGWEMFRIMDVLTAIAGARATNYIPGGIPYRNLDGPDPARSGVSKANLSTPINQGGQTAYTDAQRCIYVLFQPAAGAAGAHWELAVTGFNNVSR